jgi:hypothetical protein
VLDDVVLHTGVVLPQLLFEAQATQVFVVVSQCVPPVHVVSSTQATQLPVEVLHAVLPGVVQSLLVRQVMFVPCVTQAWAVVLQTCPVEQSLLASHCGQAHSTWRASVFCPEQGCPNWRCGVGPCAVKSAAATLQVCCPRQMFFTNWSSVSVATPPEPLSVMPAPDDSGTVWTSVASHVPLAVNAPHEPVGKP